MTLIDSIIMFPNKETQEEMAPSLLVVVVIIHGDIDINRPDTCLI